MIEIKLEGARTEEMLQRLRKAVADPSELMSGVAMLLESMSQQAFIDEGPGWASLADSTIEARTKAGSWPGKILNVSGGSGLLGSLFSDSGQDWAHVGAGSGKSAAYAMIHQFGGQAGRGKKTTIKPRPYMPITQDGKDVTPEAEASITELTLEYLDQN